MNAAEFSSIDDAPQSHNQLLIDSLAKDLTAVGYNYENVEGLLGEEAAAAFARDQLHPALRNLDRRGEDAPLACVVRLFQLGQTQEEAAINAAFPTLKTDGLLKLGLVESWASGYRAKIALALHSSDADGELWVAHDLGAHQRPGVLRTDHVLGIGQASLTLAQITIRE